MTTQQPPRYEELKRLHKPVINVNVQHKHKLTRLERLAIWKIIVMRVSARSPAASPASAH